MEGRPSGISQKIKLHLGAGTVWAKGFVNIDARQTAAVDVVADARELPFKDNTIDAIVAYHLIEHLTKKDGHKCLIRWKDLLKNGGSLILEWPDLKGICAEVAQGKEEYITHLYGLDRYRYDSHLWGYTANTMRKILEKTGYSNIFVKNGADYHVNECPCLRVEATKCRM